MAKSDSFVVLLSIPNAPSGQMLRSRIMSDKSDAMQLARLTMDSVGGDVKRVKLMCGDDEIKF